MGTAVAILAAKERREDELVGVVLSAPTIKKGDRFNVLLIAIAKLIANIAPRAGVQAIDPQAISSDPAVVKQYIEDPLVFHGKIHARTGVELLKVIELIERNIPTFVTYPIWVGMGTLDKVVHPKGAEILYQNASSQDKELKLYEGMLHEILNEPQQRDVISAIITWMDRMLAKHTAASCAPVKSAL